MTGNPASKDAQRISTTLCGFRLMAESSQHRRLKATLFQRVFGEQAIFL
ncbi:MAG: hypothetical protein ABSH38_01180 [Verrucomicrobiota bacterium]|jgi:hypothetical protein